MKSTLQKIQEKRGAYTRARRKMWLRKKYALKYMPKRLKLQAQVKLREGLLAKLAGNILTPKG